MRKLALLVFYFFLIIPFTSASSSAVSDSLTTNKEEVFDQMGMVMHHIADAHSWNVLSYKNSKGGEVEFTIPLPVILYENGKLHTFLSSAFHHDVNGVVESKGSYFILEHGKIYLTNQLGDVKMNAEHHVENERPLDLSITRNIASMWISIAIILGLFITMARMYKNPLKAPKGIQSFLEPIVLFVRDDIVYTQIGKKQGAKFLPYLMTLFFFVWLNNLLGLVPFFPGGSNLSGNIAFAMVLAVATFLITNLNGSKTYWHHLFTAPGIPSVVKVILVPVEILGVFTKPFALMIRLFANITAGHMLILSLVSMVFVFKSLYVAPPTVLIVMAMSVLELFVGVLQAYIFTLLSALFIGMAIHEEEHH